MNPVVALHAGPVGAKKDLAILADLKDNCSMPSVLSAAQKLRCLSALPAITLYTAEIVLID